VGFERVRSKVAGLILCLKTGPTRSVTSAGARLGRGESLWFGKASALKHFLSNSESGFFVGTGACLPSLLAQPSHGLLGESIFISRFVSQPKTQRAVAVGSNAGLGSMVVGILNNHLNLKWYLVGRRACADGSPRVPTTLAEYFDE
jgi:hypothetical protein